MDKKEILNLNMNRPKMGKLHRKSFLMSLSRNKHLIRLKTKKKAKQVLEDLNFRLKKLEFEKFKSKPKENFNDQESLTPSIKRVRDRRSVGQ